MRTFPRQSSAPAPVGPEDLVSRLENLPSSPEVLPRVMDALKDESSSIDTVSALISLDQGVAASVLQLSNSAYYGSGERSYRIEDAVSRVGMLKVCELVTNAVASNLFSRHVATYGIGDEELWSMSFTCARAAEKVAAQAGLEAASAYTAGFFHMAGLVAIDAWNSESRMNLRLGHGHFPLGSSAEEKRELGFTNASVAGVLLRRWSFHSKIVEPISCQYAPREAGENTPLACVLHVATWLKDAAHLPEADRPAEQPDPSILAELGLVAGDLQPLCVEVKGDYENAVQLLRSLAEA